MTQTITTPNFIIENPLTGQSVNLLPLFRLMQERHASNHPGTPDELIALVDSIARYINTNMSDTIHASEHELTNMRLYSLRDAFSGMSQVD